MKYLYIVIDLVEQKVVHQSTCFESCLLYERDNQTKALYCIELAIDDVYPCARSLKGVAL